MKLLVDIGNTATKFASIKDGEFSYIGRCYNEEISEQMIRELIPEINEVRNIYISSVAPKVRRKLEVIFIRTFKKEAFVVNNKIDSGIKLAIDNKEELGVDLLCDLVGAINEYGNKLAIVDFGTATKILFVDKDKVFSSCAIFLGYTESKKILANSTELLPEVDSFNLKRISDCHNTVDVINSSAYYSQLYSVKGIIEKYEKEVGYKVKVILTGGNAMHFLKELGEENYDECLLLKGLAILSMRY